MRDIWSAERNVFPELLRQSFVLIAVQQLIFLPNLPHQLQQQVSLYKLVGASLTSIIHFLAPPIEPLGQSPPRYETQCMGQTFVPVQNFNQMRSAVLEKMRP